MRGDFSQKNKEKSPRTIRSPRRRGWGKRIRTFGMPESESGALPLGDTPISRESKHSLVGIDGFEPSESRSQSPLPYLLAIPQDLSRTINILRRYISNSFIITEFHR